MSKRAGDLIKVKIGNKELVGMRSNSRNTTIDLADATTADSTNRWKEYIPLYKGQTFSISGLVDPDSSTREKVSELYTLLTAGTQVTIYYGGIESGDAYEEASAYLSNITEDNAYEDLQSYSCEVTVTGEPSYGTVA